MTKTMIPNNHWSQTEKFRLKSLVLASGCIYVTFCTILSPTLGGIANPS